MPDHPSPVSVIPPGATIGILGGGQLGRMTALAAARLGYRCHVYAPDAADGPAAQVCARATVAAYDDAAALAAFAATVDVVTLEFENIPLASARFLAARVPLRPGPQALEIGQDRVGEKMFFGTFAATAPWAEVHDLAGLEAALDAIGRPAVLKTTRMGYDGKGQVKIDTETSAAEAWAALGAPRGAILEGFIAFEREISVIVARAADGTTAAFEAVENRHVNHILDTTIAPAAVPAAVANEARRIALEAVARLDLVGLLAVEMFVTADGRVLVNEMAPRPHNSGHWTMDGARTDQFEQLVRAVCGLPLGDPSARCDTVMKNLLGDAGEDWPALLADPTAKLHLYGKADARPGRKMGHVNRLGAPRP
jgi:5-(carboxyamino)imidazole ribonucleotide synthase